MTVRAMTLSALPTTPTTPTLTNTPTATATAAPAPLRTPTLPAAGAPARRAGPGPLVAVGDRVAVACGASGEILLTDPGGPGAADRVLGRHGSRVTALLAGGGLVFSAGVDGRVLGHTLGSSATLSVVVGCHGAGVTAASSAGSRLATAGHDGQVLGWGDGPATPLASHRGGIEALALLPSGGVVTAGRDGRLLAHHPDGADDPVELRRRRCRPQLTLAVVAVAGGGVVTGGGAQGAVRLWDLDDADRPDEVGVHGTWVLALVTPDAGSVAAVGGGHVTFWDLRSGSAARVALGDGVHATGATVLPGGVLALGCADGRVRLVERP